MDACKKRFAKPNLMHKNIRPMEENDVPGVLALLQQHSVEKQFAQQFTSELVKAMFLPVKDTIYSYVITNTSTIQAFISFYMMKWSVLKPNAENITTLDAAYLWYHANSSVSLQSLFQDMVYLATIDAKADVITALMLCDDSEALIANKFEKRNTYNRILFI